MKSYFHAAYTHSLFLSHKGNLFSTLASEKAWSVGLDGLQNCHLLYQHFKDKAETASFLKDRTVNTQL